MKPPNRTELRDRLGRFARAGRGPARLLVLAARADLARRLSRLAVVAVVLAAIVVLLYEYGDGPPLERAAQPAAAAVATTARPGTPARQSAGRVGGSARATPARRDPGTPAAVAVAWYARQEGVDALQVRSLQQDRVAGDRVSGDRVSGDRVRVLVLADRGGGRIDTALVTVRRDAAGRWAVR
jgi:hypothetical protein